MTRNRARRIIIQRHRWLRYCEDITASAGGGVHRTPRRALAAYRQPTGRSWYTPDWSAPRSWRIELAAY